MTWKLVYDETPNLYFGKFKIKVRKREWPRKIPGSNTTRRMAGLGTQLSYKLPVAFKSKRDKSAMINIGSVKLAPEYKPKVGPGIAD